MKKRAITGRSHPRRWTSGLVFRLRALLRRGEMERELDEEIRFHLDEQARKLEASGMSADAARRASLDNFGKPDRAKEQARSAWGVRLLDDLVADLRYAFRQLFRSPLSATVAIAALALGIGGSAALFGVVHGLLLRPLPYPDDSELRVFWSDWSWRGIEFDLVRETAEAWDGLAAYSIDAGTVTRDGRASLLLTGVVSAELFDVLGTPPLLGRSFAAGDDRPGRELGIVLSYGTWQQDYGGSEGIVGDRIVLNGTPHTVIGVMPERFFFPQPEVEAWVTLDLDPESRSYRFNGWLVLLGRLRDGLGEAAIETDLRRIAAALGEQFDYPEAWDKTRNPSVQPLRSYYFGEVRPALLLLTSAVALLLLMAVANVAALLLAKMADRAPELGVRAAIGAGRLRLARQLLTESLVLALLAAGAGLVLAAALFRALVHRLPLPLGFGDTLELDWPVVIAALVLAPLAASLVSLAPLRHLLSSRRGPSGSPLVAASGQRGLVRAQGRFQESLVVVEVMLAVVLVVGASLLMRSVLRLYEIDTGIDPSGVAAIEMFAADGDLDADQRRVYFDRLLERAAALPGVRHAAITNRLPLRDGGVQGPVEAEGRPDLEGTSRPSALWRIATPGYFQSLGIEIVRGRAFDQRDRDGATPVTIVDAHFAAELWPGQDPIGRRISTTFAGGPVMEVVGIAEPVKHVEIRGPAPAVVYQPLAQIAPWESAILLLAGEGDAAPRILAGRALISELDPLVAVARSTTMEDVLRHELAQPLRLRFFLSLFSALALALGAVGVYGVVSYTVSRRTREYGLRMALGARRGDVVGEVLARGGRLVGLGIVGGVVLSLALSFLVAGFVFGIAPQDPVSFLLAALALALVGSTACFLPATRAGRVDPSEALRLE